MEFYQDDFHAILDVLGHDANREDAYAVRRACHELARLVLWRRGTRLAMAEHDVLRTLRPIVEYHAPRDVHVVVDCCRFLRRCISLKEPTELDIQSKVTEAGFLGVFRCALESHQGSHELFHEICQVVAILCFDSPNAPHADNQVEIVERGLLLAILNRMKQPTLVLAESDAAHACDAIFAIVFENVTTARYALEDGALLQCFSTLLDIFPASKAVMQGSMRILFQILTLLPEAKEEIVDLQFFEKILDFLEANRDVCDVDLLWHALKFFEMAVRGHEPAKDEFCRCRGPMVVIQAAQHVRQGNSNAPQATACLSYVCCMLLCRVALMSESISGGGGSSTAMSRVVEPRISHLMQSAAHQFALGAIKPMTGSLLHPHVAEQAIRLLELLATIEANRIPLTRLGASRQAKVVYNSTSHGGLMSLCERAISAIEGT